MALVSYPLIRVLILTGIKPDTYQSVKPINVGYGYTHGYKSFLVNLFLAL